MNTLKLIPLTLLLLGAALNAKEVSKPQAGHAEGDDHGGEHEEEAAPDVGPGKGVEAFGHDGMKLSAKAAESMGFRSTEVSGRDSFRVPIQSLVYFQDDVGVYRLRGGWIKMAHVEVMEKTKKDALLRSRDLKQGDHVVVAGAAALRVVELDLTSGEVGHGH